MNRHFLALALAGTLALSLLAGCSGGNSEPAPETSTPPATESVTPSLPGSTETPAPGVEETDTPDDTPAPEESDVPDTTTPAQKPSPTPSAQPSQTPAPKPTPAPSAKPTPAPTPTPQSNVVQSVWNEISALDIPSLSDVDADTFSALYGIDTGDLTRFVCKMPMMNVQATEFFIAEVKEGKMDAVKAGVEVRQADLEEQWSQYLPEQLELVQNYKLVTNGNYILFAISDQADKAVELFNSYTK